MFPMSPTEKDFRTVVKKTMAKSFRIVITTDDSTTATAIYNDAFRRKGVNNVEVRIDEQLATMADAMGQEQDSKLTDFPVEKS